MSSGRTARSVRSWKFPESVTVISRKAIENQQAMSLADALRRAVAISDVMLHAK